MKQKKPACPYCRHELTFSEAFKSKTNEVYYCPKCNEISRVQIKPEIKNLAIILAIVVGIAAVIFSLFIKAYIVGALIILLLFVTFYLQVPRFMILTGEQVENENKET